MTIVDTLQSLFDVGQEPALADLPAAPHGLTWEPPVTDGGETRTALTDPVDLAMALGSWTLRLIPTPQGQDGSTRLPIRISRDGMGTVTAVRIEVLRFELEADPEHLIPADYHSYPHMHLTPADGMVRLLGPGMTLVLRDRNLRTFGIEATRAEDPADPNATESSFPSARFEPPHFFVGGTDEMLGIVCDEVLLDLSRTANPAEVDGITTDPTWRGIHLKEVGLFIGKGHEVGNWAGTVAMRDFFIGFDGTDLSGTFLAELSLAAAEPDPRVAIAILHHDDDSETVVRDAEVLLDPPPIEVPAPTHGRDWVWVRLVAHPNWAEVGFSEIRWEVPAAAEVLGPHRLSALDLGWVKLPVNADGDSHAFRIIVRDSRLADLGLADEVVATRRIRVPQAAGASAGTSRLVFEGAIDDERYDVDQRPLQRLHIAMRAGERATLSLRSYGGSSAPSCTLALADGFRLTDGQMTQTASRQPGSPDEIATWQVEAPASEASSVDAAFVVSVDDGGGTLRQRRLRVRWLPSAVSQPTFRLASYSDWDDEPGRRLGADRCRRRPGPFYDHMAAGYAARRSEPFQRRCAGRRVQ